MSTSTWGKHVLSVYFVAGSPIGQRSSRFSQFVRMEPYLGCGTDPSGASISRSPPLSKGTKLCSKNASDWSNSPPIFLYPNLSGTATLSLPRRLRSEKISRRRFHFLFTRSSRKEAGQQGFGGRSKIFTAESPRSQLRLRKKLLSAPVLTFSFAPPSTLKIVTHRCHNRPQKGVMQDYC